MNHVSRVSSPVLILRSEGGEEAKSTGKQRCLPCGLLPKSSWSPPQSVLQEAEEQRWEVTWQLSRVRSEVYKKEDEMARSPAFHTVASCPPPPPKSWVQGDSGL